MTRLTIFDVDFSPLAEEKNKAKNLVSQGFRSVVQIPFMLGVQ
jgi:hypothetical protein